MDENERERGVIIPLIYTVLCLCVTIGGVFLIFYVYVPTLSRPWQPIAAFALISSTWIFWLLAYIYAFVKHCLIRHDNDARPPVPARQPTRNSSLSVSAA